MGKSRRQVIWIEKGPGKGEKRLVIQLTDALRRQLVPRKGKPNSTKKSN